MPQARSQATKAHPRRTLRRRCFELLEIDMGGRLGTRLLNQFLIWLILSNVLAVMLESVTPIYAQYGPWFDRFEIFSLSVFTVEYLARLWVSAEHVRYPSHKPLSARLRYMVSPLAIIDLLAIAPFYLLFLGLDFRALRTFRLLRLFKLLRFSPAMHTLASVLYRERRPLLAAGVIIFGLIVFSGSVIYYLERAAQPDAFASIPHGVWWAVTTLTTVGYGDVVPLTAAGKIFGGLVMIFGLGMYALPIGIIASGFAHEIRQRDFVFNWDTLATVPIFAELDPRSLAKVAQLLSARIVEEGTQITRRGEVGEAMFFIVAGRIDIRIGDAHHVLDAGDFFGEIALLRDANVYGTATALTRCRLMILEKSDFLHLLGEHPEINRAVFRAVDERLEQALNEFGLLSEEELDEVRASIKSAAARLP